ncbi:MAG: TonB-dependent receptor [Bacteroidales bacterium]|nr:TonB-dependent receptor [Bacteroidales bacterium]
MTQKIYKLILISCTFLFISQSVLSQEQADSTAYYKELLKTLTYEDLIDMPYHEFIKLSEIIGFSEDELMKIIMNQEVVTASKNAQLSSEAPATVYIMTKDQIKQNNYSFLDEVLIDIPGIEIQQKSVSEYSNYYTIRGIAGSEKFIIMMNGVKINSIAGSPHVIGKNYFIENAERVEIIIGPGSALYGADAFSGIINIITNKDIGSDNIKISSELGMFNTSSNSVFAQYGNDDISFIFDGNIYQSGEPMFPDIDFYKEDYSWYNDRYTNYEEMLLFNDTVPYGKVPYETPTKAYSIYSLLQIHDFNIGFYRNSESHSSSSGMRPEYNVYSEEAIYKINIQSIFGSYNYLTNNERLNIETSFAYSSYEISPESNFINIYTSFNNGYKYGTEHSFKLEEQFDYKLSDNSNIIAGLALENIFAQPKSGDLPFKYDRNLPSDYQDFYYLGTNITDSAENDLSIIQNIYNVNYQNYSLYFQYQQKIYDKFGITAGCRYDYNTRYKGNFNPRVALVYNPSEKLKISVLYNEAFLAPSPYTSYEQYGSFGSNTDNNGNIIGLESAFWHLPNSDLKPEKLKSLELNNTYFLNKNLSYTLSGFYNKITNLITDEKHKNEIFKDIPVSVVKRKENNSYSNTYGGNISLNWMYSYGSRFNIKYNFSYSYVNGNIGTGRLYYSAKSSVKSGITFSSKKLNISPRLVYRSRSYHELFKTESSDPFYYINLNCNYLLMSNEKYAISCFVKINNLLNNKYYNISFADIEGFAQTPQDPFRLNAGIKLKIK